VTPAHAIRQSHAAPSWSGADRQAIDHGREQRQADSQAGRAAAPEIGAKAGSGCAGEHRFKLPQADAGAAPAISNGSLASTRELTAWPPIGMRRWISTMTFDRSLHGPAT